MLLLLLFIMLCCEVGSQEDDAVGPVEVYSPIDFELPIMCKTNDHNWLMLDITNAEVTVVGYDSATFYDIQLFSTSECQSGKVGKSFSAVPNGKPMFIFLDLLTQQTPKSAQIQNQCCDFFESTCKQITAGIVPPFCSCPAIGSTCSFPTQCLGGVCTPATGKCDAPPLEGKECVQYGVVTADVCRCQSSFTCDGDNCIPIQITLAEGEVIHQGQRDSNIALNTWISGEVQFSLSSDCSSHFAVATITGPTLPITLELTLNVGDVYLCSTNELVSVNRGKITIVKTGISKVSHSSGTTDVEVGIPTVLSVDTIPKKSLKLLPREIALSMSMNCDSIVVGPFTEGYATPQKRNPIITIPAEVSISSVPDSLIDTPLTVCSKFDSQSEVFSANDAFVTFKFAPHITIKSNSVMSEQQIIGLQEQIIIVLKLDMSTKVFIIRRPAQAAVSRSVVELQQQQSQQVYMVTMDAADLNTAKKKNMAKEFVSFMNQNPTQFRELGVTSAGVFDGQQQLDLTFNGNIKSLQCQVNGNWVFASTEVEMGQLSADGWKNTPSYSVSAFSGKECVGDLLFTIDVTTAIDSPISNKELSTARSITIDGKCCDLIVNCGIPESPINSPFCDCKSLGAPCPSYPSKMCFSDKCYRTTGQCDTLPAGQAKACTERSTIQNGLCTCIHSFDCISGSCQPTSITVEQLYQGQRAAKASILGWQTGDLYFADGDCTANSTMKKIPVVNSEISVPLELTKRAMLYSICSLQNGNYYKRGEAQIAPTSVTAVHTYSGLTDIEAGIPIELRIENSPKDIPVHEREFILSSTIDCSRAIIGPVVESEEGDNLFLLLSSSDTMLSSSQLSIRYAICTRFRGLSYFKLQTGIGIAVIAGPHVILSFSLDLSKSQMQQVKSRIASVIGIVVSSVYMFKKPVDTVNHHFSSVLQSAVDYVVKFHADGLDSSAKKTFGKDLVTSISKEPHVFASLGVTSAVVYDGSNIQGDVKFEITPSPIGPTPSDKSTDPTPFVITGVIGGVLLLVFCVMFGFRRRNSSTPGSPPYDPRSPESGCPDHDGDNRQTYLCGPDNDNEQKV